MRAEIISVGTELLLGDIVNTNAQYLAQELAVLGFSVYNQSVVGDNPGRLRALVQEAKERSELLLFTGGLGPTDDDLTKETVADVFGDTLVPDAEELRRLEEFFASLGRKMTPNNRKQAMVPRLGRKLVNNYGTAPGAFFRQGNRYAILLPGPPREMKPMFEEQVRPLLEEMQSGAIRSVTLRVFGIGESELEAKLGDLLTGNNPTAALYAKTGEVHVRITARAPTAEQADLLCEDYAQLFRRVLGETLYSIDGSDMETVVVQTLAAKGESVALAESCTGGLLAERITSVPGSSHVFGYGAVTYDNDIKHKMLGVQSRTLRRHGAVSSQVAAEMAFGVAKKGDADYGVGITGIAGPGGGTKDKPVGLVYVAVAHGRHVYVKRLSITDRDRDYVRTMATQHALDMVRRLALNLSIPSARQFARNQYADFERVGTPRFHGGALGRAITAVLLVAGLFALLMVGLYYFQQNNVALRLSFPSTQKLQYGTDAYTKAAQALVAREKESNPAVTGFIGMPGDVESLVGKGVQGQDALEEAAAQPGMDSLSVVGAGSVVNAPAANTMLLGSKQLKPLLQLRNTENAAQVSTFTYYTERDARVYKVFAVLQLDEDERLPDGFDPETYQLSSYHDYLTFLLGARGRSLYDTSVDVRPDDSFMTLAVDDTARDGRRFFMLGRLLRPGETDNDLTAAPAGSPLLPELEYTENSRKPPEFRALYQVWMRDYLARDMTGAELQLRAGVPDEDIPPLVPVEQTTGVSAPEPDPEESESTSASPSGSTSAGTSGSTPAGAAESTTQSSPESAPQSSTSAANTPLKAGKTAAARPLAAHYSGQSIASGQLDNGVGSAMDSSTPESSTSATSTPASSSASQSSSNTSGSGASSSNTSSSSSTSSSSKSGSSGSSGNSGSTSGGGTAPNAGTTPSGAPLTGTGTNVGDTSGSGSGDDASSSSTESESKASAPVPMQRLDPGMLTVRMNGRLVRDTTVNVLASICQSEMPSAPAEAIKAQAVAIHSWILNQQGAGNPAPAVRGRTPGNAVLMAVRDVSSMILTPDDDAPACTPWFHMAARATNSSADLWGTTRPYLEPVSSTYEEGMDGWREMLTLPRSEFAALVQARFGTDLEATGEAHTWVSEIERNDGGYVTTLLLGGVEVSGYDFWNHIMVQEGKRILNSPAFEVEYSGDAFIFTVYGAGHGCGLSQQGAIAMASREDATYTQILEHYYPGLRLMAWE